jgi:hypothetical protein
MKRSATKLGAFFLALGFTLCHTEVWSADWKEFAETTAGIFYYDKASVTSPSRGFFRVWIHSVNKHETSLIEINCREKDYRVLDVVEYDETDRMKDRFDYYDNPDWLVISQNTVPEPLHSILCPLREPETGL